MPIDDNLIREQFKRMGYNVSRTARSLDLDYERTKELLAPDIEPVKGPTEPRPPDFRQLGKVGLKRFVIAVRPINVPGWPAEFENSIISARRSYDAGTHDMFQETRDGWNILYCQKRKTAVVREPYFSKVLL